MKAEIKTPYESNAYVSPSYINVNDIDSTSVHAWAWNGNTQVLHVTYKSDLDSTYLYESVPFGVVYELLNCQSVGKTINSLVKGFYKFVKIGD